jgi:neutral ceramidase
MRLIAFVLLAATQAYGADLRAGVAQAVITPPKGAPMAGYYRQRAAEGTHDDLYAKALVFEKDGVKVALVACDLVSLPRREAEEARRIIQQKLGIPPDHVMISATHSHTGPVILTEPSRYNLQGEMKRIAEEYAAALPLKIAEAVIAANAALTPAQVRSGIGREESLGFNRRYFMRDGTVAWNPGKLNPLIVRPAGPVDSSVPVVYVETPEGKPIASYVNYAVHQDTTGGLLFSADYAYALGKVLSAAKGPEFITLFTIGCAGNVNHVDVNRKEAQSGFGEASRIGAVLAGQVLKTIQRAPVVPVSSIRVHSEVVKLPLPDVAPQDVKWANTTSATFGGPNAAPFIDLVRAAKIVEVAGRNGQPLEAEVQVIALGDQVAFVGLPGEIFAETGLTMKQDSPFPNTIVAALANGVLGYIPNRQAYRQGAYEVVSSRCAAGSAEMLLDSALRQLIELFSAAVSSPPAGKRASR